MGHDFFSVVQSACKGFGDLGAFGGWRKLLAWHLCFIHQFLTVCFSGVTLQNSLSIDCPGDSWKGDWKIMSMVDFQKGKRSYLYFQIKVKARTFSQDSKSFVELYVSAH